MAAATDPDAHQRHFPDVPLGNLCKHTVDRVLPRPPCKGSELSFAAPKTVLPRSRPRTDADLGNDVGLQLTVSRCESTVHACSNFGSRCCPREPRRKGLNPVGHFPSPGSVPPNGLAMKRVKSVAYQLPPGGGSGPVPGACHWRKRQGCPASGPRFYCHQNLGSGGGGLWR